MEFTIPLTREDLLNNDGRGTYVVSEPVSAHELVSRIDECQTLFAEAGPSAITECFDVLYSVIHHFSTIDNSVKETYWNMIAEALVDSFRLFDTSRQLQIVDKDTKRNTIKMLVYVAAQLVELFENEVFKPDSISINKKGRKSKKSTLSSDSDGCGSMWENERERIVEILSQVLEQDLVQVCDPPTPEMLDDLINLVAGCCYKFLENPVVVRDKDLKDSISNLLGTIVKNYHQNLGVSVKIVQLLQHFEHLVSPLSQMLVSIVNKYELNNFVADIIREIGEKDPQDLTIDSSGTKNYSLFITEVSQALPKLVKPSVTTLLPHLNGESQTMRNGVLCVLGEVVVQVLSGPDIDGESRNLRDSLLDRLQEHIHDVHAYVRSKVLQVWLLLCEAKSIPLPRFKDLLNIVCGRLKDKSSLVRKSALQLLTGFVTGNPFAAKLDLKHFESLLTTEAEKLRSMLPQQESDGEKSDCVDSEAQVHKDVNGDSHKDSENTTEETGPTEHEIEVVKQMGIVQYFKDAVSFIEKMINCIPLATQLLGSKMSTDIHEALEFLAAAQEFELPGAREGIRKSLLLMSSSEQAIRELVVSVYVRLYLSPSEDRQNSDITIIQNLLSLVDGASIGELAALEEMLLSLMKGSRLPKSVIGIFWDIFAGKVPWAKSEDVKYSLIILSMIAKADKRVIEQNIRLLLDFGLQSTDLITAKYTCMCLLCLSTHSSSTVKPTRFPSTHPLVTKISELMLDTFSSLSTSHWIPFAEQAIVTIYKLSEQPDVVLESILKILCHKVFGESEIPQDGSLGFCDNLGDPLLSLSRLLFVAGHTTQLQLLYLESGVRCELKRRRLLQDDTTKNTESTIEDEMGLMGMAVDDVEAELIRRVCNDEVCGQGLLGALLPIIITVVTKPGCYTSEQLQTSAALALSKYMIVSSRVCEKYLRLFFTLLETSPTPSIRANAIIALGDLIIRFPNQIEPWTKHIYSRLCDPDSEVRQNTVVVLTHLILNDMVKVKGQLSEMALCLEDSVPRIVDRVKLFFMELSRKGNALYNILPDIISRLSDPNNNISTNTFRNIMKYLFSLIQKDRQCEGLVEKLCHRFRASRTEQQGQHLAFCLSQLSFSERSLRKLQENMSCYQGLLSDTDVYNSFLIILGKLKKFPKPEVKVLVEEFEIKLKEAHKKGIEDDNTIIEDNEHNEENKDNPHENKDNPLENDLESDIGNNDKSENQSDTLVCTPVPPQSTSKKRGLSSRKPKGNSSRKPLQEPNTPKQPENFNISAVSSARRSGQKITGLTSFEDENNDIVRSVRKRGPGRNVSKPMVLSDSDQD